MLRNQRNFTIVSRCIKNWTSFPRVTDVRGFANRCFKNPCCINSLLIDYWKTATKFTILSKLCRGNIILSASSVWMECKNRVFRFVSIAKTFLQIDFWEEWLGGLRRCDRIGRYPTQTQNSPEAKLISYTNELCMEKKLNNWMNP